MSNKILGAICVVSSLFAGDGALALEEIQDGLQAVLVEPETGMQFIALDGGCFLMASIDSEVCVSPFAMGRFEVTNGDYLGFDADHKSGHYDRHDLSGAESPVVNVSWLQANAFATWLSAQTGLPIRLPSEAEWEYAARGGSDTDWFWGDDAESAFRFANFSGRDADGRLVDGFAATAPIASFDPNPFGLFDMLGNASEWVADAYSTKPDRYGTSLQDPIVNTGEGPLRVRRGGSFDQRLSQVSDSSRDFYLESLGVPQTGFRLVLELPQ